MFRYSIFILICLVINCFSQVNIEKYRSGSQGDVDSVNSKYFNISASAIRSTSSMYNIGFSYFAPVDFYGSVDSFLLSKVKYSRKNSEDYDKDYFVHFRVLSKYKIFNFYPESFFQFEKNNSSLTTLRYLAGIGGRYSLLNGLVLGTSILNEWYRESEPSSKVSVWRLSQYLKASFVLNQMNQINITVYIQPKVIDFSNIRYFGELNLVNQLTQDIAYNSTVTAKYFSKSEEYSDVELFFNSGIQVKL